MRRAVRWALALGALAGGPGLAPAQDLSGAPGSGPWTLHLGLLAENPESNPAQFGLATELRWWLPEGAWLGLGLGWAGGVNDSNPNTLRIAQRAETVATLGGRLPLTDALGLSLGGHAGLMMVWGWPRGLLRDLHGELGPWLGAHLAADWRLSPRWALAPRVSLGTVRLLQSWLLVPGAGLDLVWRFGE